MAVPVSVEGTSSVEYAGTLDRIVRVGRGVVVALAIVGFWTGALALAWLLVPYVLLSEREKLARRRKLQRVVASSWAGFLRFLEAITIYRARYVGELPADGPCVLVANHPSLLDVTAIISRMPHACCVVKSSLVNSPLVGHLLRACGHVAAGDGSLSAGMGVLEAVRERLQEGFPVLIFPEGTRSPRGGMHRFRRGAFEIAQRAGVPVVPVFLRCDPPALGKGTPVWRHPRCVATLTVHIEPPMNLDQTTPVAACQRVQLDFRSRLGLPQPASQPEKSEPT